MDDIVLSISESYSSKGKRTSVDIEAYNDRKLLFIRSFKAMNQHPYDVAKSLIRDLLSHNIAYPSYTVIVSEGHHPQKLCSQNRCPLGLEKVHALYTRLPNQDYVQELSDLLGRRNFIVTSKNQIAKEPRELLS